MSTRAVFFSDLPLNFIANPITADISTLKNEAAVKRALLNLLKTPRGSRPFRPDYGTRVYDYLFDQADSSTEYEINDILGKEIQRFEPRVRLSLIETNIEDQHGIKIRIEYFIVNDPAPQTLETVITRVR